MKDTCGRAQADTKNVLLVGVGGQGIITASTVLAQAALMAGYDVKKSEVHGMSQRGGSVESHVRISPTKVSSPLIEWGKADVVLALEVLEALRNSHWVRPGGVIITDERQISPTTVARGGYTYPEDALARLQSLDARVIVVPSFAIAEELGEIRAANIVMLGALCEMLPLGVDVFQAAMKTIIKPKALAINIEAFKRGQAAAVV